MSQVLVSSKYQVVIPKEVRRELHIVPGQKMSCVVIDRSVHLVPVRPLKELRGMISAFPIKDVREKKDRL